MKKEFTFSFSYDIIKASSMYDDIAIELTDYIIHFRQRLGGTQ